MRSGWEKRRATTNSEAHVLEAARSSSRRCDEDPIVLHVLEALRRFVAWLDAFGGTSRDHQSFFAGPVGRTAKSLYYRQKLLGTAAVAPMIFCEAFLPSARRLFHHRTRFPIADAHYAMGFGYLYDAVGNPEYLKRGVGYLDVLKGTRCPGFEEYCWGYPFDWVTRNGTISRQTPLITTTPYAYEAFLLGYELCRRQEWRQVLASIARHALTDIKEFRVSADSATCSYTPFDCGGVINAAAYRAFLLTSASKLFAENSYWEAAQRNLNFVLDAQNADGSWYYAVDGVRNFVDHFHTCFVMKALAKIHTLTDHERCLAALAKGVEYYATHLFDSDGLPKPFSKAPRLTTYKRELYDCAECINLCLLLKDRFPQLEQILATVVASIMSGWVKSDGSFRSRQLLVGWDNVPMHRWAQSQMFRSLAFFVSTARGTAAARHSGARASAERLPIAPAVHAV
jgi:hypothetical protein